MGRSLTEPVKHGAITTSPADAAAGAPQRGSARHASAVHLSEGTSAEQDHDIVKDFERDWSSPPLGPLGGNLELDFASRSQSEGLSRKHDMDMAMLFLDMTPATTLPPSLRFDDSITRVLSLPTESEGEEHEDMAFDIVKSFQSDWSRASFARRLRATVLRGTGLQSPRYGFIDRLSCCTAPALAVVYATVSLGTATSSTPCVRGSHAPGAVTFAAPDGVGNGQDLYFDFDHDDELWVTFSEKRPSRVCEVDVLIGTGMCDLSQVSLRQGGAHRAKVPLIRQSRIAGFAELLLQLVDPSENETMKV